MKITEEFVAAGGEKYQGTDQFDPKRDSFEILLINGMIQGAPKARHMAAPGGAKRNPGITSHQ